MPRPRLVAVGRIGRPHGVKGEVRLEAGTALPRGLGGYTRFYLEPPRRPGAAAGELSPVVVEGARANGRFQLVKFEGVGDPDAAGRLVHSMLYVERAEMPPLEPGEYYHADLLGCRVVDEAGAELGRVHDVIASGAHDLLIVRAGRTGSQEWMVPVIDDYVTDMDLEAGVIRVRVPEGGF